MFYPSSGVSQSTYARHYHRKQSEISIFVSVSSGERSEMTVPAARSLKIKARTLSHQTKSEQAVASGYVYEYADAADRSAIWRPMRLASWPLATLPPATLALQPSRLTTLAWRAAPRAAFVPNKSTSTYARRAGEVTADQQHNCREALILEGPPGGSEYLALSSAAPDVIAVAPYRYSLQFWRGRMEADRHYSSTCHVYQHGMVHKQVVWTLDRVMLAQAVHILKTLTNAGTAGPSGSAEATWKLTFSFSKQCY
eukprot:scaffold19531_cov44-Prasinocladus_malaysianus.AAC.3